jgi:hypothetical protein
MRVCGVLSVLFSNLSQGDNSGVVKMRVPVFKYTRDNLVKTSQIAENLKYKNQSTEKDNQRKSTNSQRAEEQQA